MRRTDQDIDKFLEQAKLDSADLRPLVQPLWFAEEQHGSLRLLEVDKDLLKVLKEGERYIPFSSAIGGL